MTPAILLALAALAAAEAPIAPATQKAFLVTGASTGFGRRIAERLAADGHLVYAGARKEADLAALSAIPNVKGIRLDVTKPQEIAAAVELVTRAGRGLHGLVNNAGVAVSGPFVQAGEADYHYVMDVNALGVFRVTMAFLPLLQAGKGRVVNMGSAAGFLGPPRMGLYAMSKHAVEAFTDTLAAEAGAAGVEVSVVEPGFFQTELIATMLKRARQAPVPDAEQIKRLEAFPKLKDPEEVAQAVKRALLDERPQRRYMVTSNKEEATRYVQALVRKVVQVNQGHPYELTRDELVAVVDAALAQAKGGVAQK